MLTGLVASHIIENSPVHHCRRGPIPRATHTVPACLAMPACHLLATVSHPCQYALFLLSTSLAACPIPVCVLHPCLAQAERLIPSCMPCACRCAPYLPERLIPPQTPHPHLHAASVCAPHPCLHASPLPCAPPLSSVPSLCAPSLRARRASSAVPALSEPRGSLGGGGGGGRGRTGGSGCSPPPSPPPGSRGPRPRAPPCPAGPGGAAHPAPLAEARRGGRDAGAERRSGRAPVHHSGASREEDGGGGGATPGYRRPPARPRPGAPRRRAGKGVRGLAHLPGGQRRVGASLLWGGGGNFARRGDALRTCGHRDAPDPGAGG